MSNHSRIAPPDRSLRIASEKVLHDTVDDETVVINLTLGHYYTLEGVASILWTKLVEGLSAGQAVQWLVENFEVTVEAATGDVDTFVDAFLQEGLLSVGEQAPPSASPISPTQGRKRYPNSKLEKHTDVEALLLADPIHEFR